MLECESTDVISIDIYSFNYSNHRSLLISNVDAFLKIIPNSTRGKSGSCIKGGFLYFSPNFSTQMNVSLPFERHNVAYQCKGLDQNTIVCEYEVNLSTNEKVMTEKQNF